LDDELIEDAIEKEEELWRLTVKELQVKLVEQGLIQSGAKAVLIERLMNPQPADFKNKPKVEPWRNSKAKALLIRFLMNKLSLFHLLSPDEAWESSEWFKQYPKDRFIKNTSNLKKHKPKETQSCSMTMKLSRFKISICCSSEVKAETRPQPKLPMDSGSFFNNLSLNLKFPKLNIVEINFSESREAQNGIVKASSIGPSTLHSGRVMQNNRFTRVT
jgi:hypothetical protein